MATSSELNCGAYQTAGKDFDFSIQVNDANANYTHTIDWIININKSTLRTTSLSAGVTSGTFNWQDAEVLTAIEDMDGAFGYTGRATLKTYNGSTLIGSRVYKITFYNPARDSDFYFPNEIVVGTQYYSTMKSALADTNKNNKLTFDIGLSRSTGFTSSDLICTFYTGLTGNQSLILNTNDYTETIYDKIHGFGYATDGHTNIYLVVRGKYNGTEISCVGYSVAVDCTNAPPKFASSTITYSDTNSTTSGITGNNQYIIQNKSTLQVVLPTSSLATGRCGGTISNYQCQIANRNISLASTGSALTFNVGTINATGNTQVKITAFDDRGNSISITKTVLVVPYTPPTITLTAQRTEAFSESMQINANGKFSNLKVGSAYKGTINTITAYVSTNDGAYASVALTKTVAQSAGTYTGAITQTLSLANVASVYVVVKDNLSTTVTSATVSVPSGIPIFYIDANLGSAGFLKVPTESAILDMGMKIKLPKNQYWSDSYGSYGIDMQNSDIINMNKLVFSDHCNNVGEGIIWMNTGTSGSTPVVESGDMSQYTQTYWRDNAFFLNNTKRVSFANDSTYPTWQRMNLYGIAGLTLNIGSFDTASDKKNGLIIQSSNAGAMHIDSNEILSVNATNDGYKDLTIAGTNVGIYAKALRLQVGTDTDINSSSWAGFTIEQGTYNGTTFTTSGNRFSMDANELYWTRVDKSDYTQMYGNAKAYTWYVWQQDTSGTPQSIFALKASHDSNSTFNGYLQCGAVYQRTTTSSANVNVTSAGTILRSTSSAKAKLDIVPAFDTLEDYKQILNIEPVKWFDKSNAEMTAELMTAEYNGEEIDVSGGVGNINRVYGCVAEQLEEVGLGCLVEYDANNEEIMGVAYDRIPIMYIPLIKDLYNQIDQLKQEIKTLKN